MKKVLTLFLLLCSSLTFGVSLPPEEELQMLLACGEKSVVSFSEALRELLPGITDTFFDEEFIDRIAKIEKDLDGEYSEHWDNGQLKLRVTFKKGVPDGHFHGWFPNGDDAFKGYLAAGTKQGVHMAFFPIEDTHLVMSHSGRKLSYNRKGRLQGVQCSHHLRKNSKVLFSCCDGVMDGSLFVNDENWDPIYRKHFDMGKEIPKPEGIR